MRKQITTSLALTLLMTIMARAGSLTEDFSRAGKWEAYGFGQYTSIAMVGGEGGLWGGGVGIGYCALDQLCINADVSINYSSFGTGTTIYMGDLSLDYNILKKRLTPFLTLGVGALGMEGDGDVLFDGNLGAGLRWDASDRVFVKVACRAMILTQDIGYLETVGYNITLAVGFRF